MEKKARILRTTSVVFKAVAWLIAVVGGGIVVLFLLLSPSTLNVATEPRDPAVEFIRRIFTAGITGIFIAFYWLIFYAAGLLIEVVLAIEENTRVVAARLGQSNDNALERGSLP